MKHLVEDAVRVSVEAIIKNCGVHGDAVIVLRHVLLVVTSLLLAWLSMWLCKKFIPVINRLTRHTVTRWDDIILNSKVLTSACHIVPAIVVWELLPMIFYQFPVVKELLARLTAAYIAIMSLKTLLVLINSLDELDSNDKRWSSRQQYIKSFCGLLKIVASFVITIIVIAILLGKNPMSLLAGLGATSAILMLVFKDTIEGLVAGIRLTSNNMVHKGDWITMPSANVNGIVQDITLSTVKVQNFDNTIVTVSPTSLVSGSFQNWIGMQKSGGRRVQRKVYFDFRSIHFVDDEQHLTNMGQFRHAMENYLRSRKDVNSDMTLMVRQLEATQCGLPIEFYFFLNEKVWPVYESHLAEIMEYIYVKASDFGLKVYQQYPEQ